jgi:anhydro-N-acetylmuramic acid kinase
MRVIGVTSGTSFDAIEALLVELVLPPRSTTLTARLVEHRSLPYPPEVRDALAAALPPRTTTAEQICRLDVAIGQAFAEAAKGLVVAHGPVDVICSHGQTVYHWVDGRSAKGTLQLGEPAWVAERTGATVVSDVRNRDIAAGGQGAPLACLLDVLLLGTSPEAPTGCLNLGGIGNVTVLRPGQKPIAFDTGPANALIDATVAWLSAGAQRYDHGGALAARGHAGTELVRRLLDEPYFSLQPPKSTGKELFNLEYVTSRLRGEQLRPEDLVASVTAASAESVAAALRPYQLAQLFVTGGGARNPVLMGELACRLPGVKLRSTAELGLPEAAKESLLFAVIGFFTVCGFQASIPSCTGAAHASVLGSITPGASPLPPRPTGLRTPTRLVLQGGPQ